MPWRGKWATELGGVLMGHAIHPHDLFVYLMGPIVSLFGRTATRVNDIEVEDCISASVELQSGALGSFTASLGSADEITRIRLAFDNVTFESDHAPYNPGAAPWKILPRNDATKTAIDTLLKEVGSDKSKLLAINIYLPAIADFDAMNVIYDAWVDKDNPPVRACVEARLANPDLRIEITAVAAA